MIIKSTRDGNPNQLVFFINYQKSESAISDSDSGFGFQFFQHNNLNLKIGKILLEWQIQIYIYYS